MVNREAEDILTDLLFSLYLLTAQSLLRSDARYFLMHELRRGAAQRPAVDVSALANARS